MKQFFVQSKVGQLGEKIAKRYIESQGHKVVALNYYPDKGKRLGEIDIISRFQGAIHFIEVKARNVFHTEDRGKALYFPIEAQVTPAKMRKCLKTAEQYLRATRQEHCEYHFDIITVLYTAEDKKAEVQYLQDVFY